MYRRRWFAIYEPQDYYIQKNEIRNNDDERIGKHSRNKWDIDGVAVAVFLKVHGLFVSNIAFQLAPRHNWQIRYITRKTRPRENVQRLESIREVKLGKKRSLITASC